MHTDPRTLESIQESSMSHLRIPKNYHFQAFRSSTSYTYMLSSQNLNYCPFWGALVIWARLKIVTGPSFRELTTCLRTSTLYPTSLGLPQGNQG